MDKYFRKKGMTLAEIMTAVGLLSVIIVVILGVFVKGSYAIKKTRYRLTALNVADAKIAELKNLDLTFNGDITRGDILENIVNVDKVEVGFPVRTSATSITSDTDAIYIWSQDREYKITGTEHIKDVDYEYVIFVENCSIGDIDGNPSIVELKRVSVLVSWTKSEERKSVEIRTLIARPEP